MQVSRYKHNNDVEEPVEIASSAFDRGVLLEDVGPLAAMVALRRKCLLQLVLQWGESHSPGMRLHHCAKHVPKRAVRRSGRGCDLCGEDNANHESDGDQFRLLCFSLRARAGVHLLVLLAWDAVLKD